MKTTTTCGPLFKKQFDLYTEGDHEKSVAFRAGFISGQAEKIYLGACGAAMFRPNAEELDLTIRIAGQAAENYGLGIDTLNKEIWIFDQRLESLMALLRTVEPSSPAAHLVRGILCGVPKTEIDFFFHERLGFGERCDEVKR